MPTASKEMLRWTVPSTMPARRGTIRNRVIDADLCLQLRLFGNGKHENKDGIIVIVLFFFSSEDSNFGIFFGQKLFLKVWGRMCLWRLPSHRSLFRPRWKLASFSWNRNLKPLILNNKNSNNKNNKSKYYNIMIRFVQFSWSLIQFTQLCHQFMLTMVQHGST